jgi:hypothetical protein
MRMGVRTFSTDRITYGEMLLPENEIDSRDIVRNLLGKTDTHQRGGDTRAANDLG